MRIKVLGDCSAARVLRGYLESKGNCRLVEKVPDYSVYITENNDLDTVVVDSIDCPLERYAINMMYEKGVPSFRLIRAGGIQSDSEIHITYPSKYQEAVELGLYRALTHHDWKREHKALKNASKKVGAASLFLLLVLLASLAHSDPLPKYFTRSVPIQAFFQANFPIIRVLGTDLTSNLAVGDVVNNAVRVNCITGCAGGAVDQGAGAGAATLFWNVRLTDGTSFYKGLTDAELRATPVPISGTVSVTEPVTVDAVDLDIRNLTATDIVTLSPGAAATSNNDGACVSLTTTSSTILASFATRAFAAICSRVTNTDISYLKLAATATTSDYPLEIGQCINFSGPKVYTGIIDGRSNTGTQSVCVVEW